MSHEAVCRAQENCLTISVAVLHQRMSSTKLAVEIFDSGLTCTEAVAMAGMKRMGRQSDLIPRIATGFGGGLSRTKSVCGALTGGVLVLSAAFGRDKLGDDRDVLVSKVPVAGEGISCAFWQRQLLHPHRPRFQRPGCAVPISPARACAMRGYVEYVCERLDELL